MSTNIHPSAIVETGAQLGEDVRIGPYCYVGAEAVVGDRCELMHHASVTGHTSLSEDCVLHAHATIGGSPQSIGFKESNESRLSVGPRSIFREFTSAHTGLPTHRGETTIGADCYIMATAHIGHDCAVGSKVVIANGVQIGGHVQVGNGVWMGGLVAIHQFTRIGRNAFLGGGAIVVEDVIPFASVVGNRAYVAGLNYVGLQRNGFSKADIRSIRGAYKALFAGEGQFSQRVERVANSTSNDAFAKEIIDFVLAGDNRPICQPRAK